MIDCGKMTETLGQLIHLDGKIVSGVHFRTFQTGRAKNMAETLQDTFRHIDTLYLALIDKSDTVALTGFVHDRSGNKNCDTLILKMPQHFPELLARNRIHTGSRLVQKKNLRLMNQRTTQSKFLLHSPG